ncbi:hypothetical protein B0H17DRAFT_1124928 [Mycena rosella]|uniref:MYND-type domain-containing protein n=1 Tax=Mycena rosella TaxID=1033263 RepID=A0AAD7GYI6_MYCRO|nr:hypothetical protein B0H17DRAFT_1124928 [Mycena rosella]
MSTAVNRELTVELLRSMSVELPPKTKLPDAELDKRLSKTLDGCQYLAPAQHRGIELYLRHATTYPLYVDPFMYLRQSIMTIGKNWDEGLTTMTLADKEQTGCIFMRITEVLEFDKHTPILMVLFRQELRGIQPSPSMVKWILSQENGNNGKGMPRIFATPKEQHLLMRLLQRNSERLPTAYKPQRTAIERDFVPSFILPVGPLGGKEVARFNKNDGCSVCGDPAKSKCSRCNVKRYCGAVCQKEDWKAHRPTCTSLKSAKWQTVPFVPLVIFMKAVRPAGAIPFRFNRYDNLNSADVNMMADAMMEPGQKASASGVSILIYDRRRSIEVTLVKFVGPTAAFEPIAALVKEKGQRGLRLFLWATRSGEWSLDLCVDQVPEWQQW